MYVVPPCLSLLVTLPYLHFNTCYMYLYVVPPCLSLFGIFVEELTGQKFMSSGITQSAVLQKAKLKIVLDKIHKILQLHPTDPDRKWSIDGIYMVIYCVRITSSPICFSYPF